MNNYGGQEAGATTAVPPGWDSWRGWQGGYNEHGNFYKVNVDGRIQTFDRREIHDTDWMRDRANEFVGQRDGRPWFMVVSTNAPHSPSFSPPRDAGNLRQAQMPKPPNFNELDVSDKPT